MPYTYPNTTTNSVTVKDYIEFSFRECGVLAEQQTPQYVDAAKLCLHHVLQDLQNKGVLLFQLRYILLGSRAGQRQLTLPAGTIDVREANYRYPINPVPTAALPTSNPTSANAFDRNLAGSPAVATSTDNWFGAQYASPLRLLHVGINSFGGGTYNPILEYSSDGMNWTTFQTLPTVTLNDGEWQYWQVDGAPNASYWRIRQTTVILQLRQLVLGNVQQDIRLYRLNRDDYFDLPNKDFLSNRALQYWFDRQQPSPIMNLWPVPQDDFQIFQLLTEAQMPDVGLLGTPLPIPDRWTHAIQSLLSSKLSLQLNGVDPNRITLLQQAAIQAYKIAAGEERDKSDLTIMPLIGVYTR